MFDTHIFLHGNVFNAKLGGENNKNCSFKGLANFKIAKPSIFVHIKPYHTYQFSFFMEFSRPYKAILQGAVWRKSAKWRNYL